MAHLSEEQIEASDLADANGEDFGNLEPAQVFSPGASGTNLAQTLYRVNPRRYRELRDQYELESGARPYPVEHWHGGTQ